MLLVRNDNEKNIDRGATFAKTKIDNKEKTMKIIISLLMAVFIGSISASEQISDRGVKKIQAYSTYAVIHLDVQNQNLDGCTKSNAKSVVIVTYDSEKGKELYSTILSARISGALVGYGVNGCHMWGDGTAPLVYRVDL